MTVVAQLMVKIGADIAGAVDGLRKVSSGVSDFAQTAGQKLNSVGDSFTGVGKKATLMTAPIAAGMAVAVAKVADFESQVNILDVTMKDSAVTGEQWSAVALKIGADSELVGISASQAVEGITNLGKAGLDTTGIFGDMQGYLSGTTSLHGALRTAVDLAAASELDLNQASMATVQTMNQYGLTVEQTAGAMNNMVQSADASTASVTQLLDAHANFGPIASQMGMSVEQVNIQLAALHDRGIMGAEAGTALKAMWMHMTNASTKAGDALQQLGVNLYDSTGNMRSAKSIVTDLSNALNDQATYTYQAGGATKAQAKELAGYESKIRSARSAIEEYNAGVRGTSLTEAKRAEKIAELNAKITLYEQKHRDLASSIPGVTSETRKMNDAMRDQFMQMLAGAYGIKSLSILVDEGAEGWEGYEKAIAGATTMQDQAAARTQGFAAAMEQFKSVVETFMITAAMPFVRDFLTPFIRKAGEMLQKIMQVHPGFAKWAFAIGAVLVVVGPLLIAIGSIISAIGTIVGAIGGAIGLFSGLAGVIGAAAAAIGSALLPIIAIIALVAGAVALFRLAWENNFLGIRDALQPVVDAVKRAFAYIGTIWTNFKAFLHGDMTWEQFKEKAALALNAAKEAILQAFESLKEGLVRIWENIKAAIVNKLAEFIAPLVGGMDNAKRIVTQAWENIKTFLTTTWENIKAAASRVWEGIKQAIQSAIETVRQVVAAVLQVLSGDWVGAWERIKAKLVEVWETIKTVISTVIGVIVGVISEGWEKVFGVVSGVMERIKTAIQNAWESIKEVWAKLHGQDQQITDPAQAAEQIRIWKQMVTELTAAWQQMAQTVTTIANAVKQFLDAWLASVQASFTTVWMTIQAFLQTTWTAIQTFAMTWLAAMLTLITTHLQQVQTTFITFWTAIQTYLYNTWVTIQTQLATILATMLTNVQQTNATMLASFTSTWAAIVSAVVNAATTMSSQTIAIVTDYAAGQAFGDAFAAGIRSKIPDVAAAAADMAAAAAAYLPGSDAEKGALSNLTERGRQFGITFAQGMMQSAGAVADAGGAIGSMLLLGMSDNVDVGNVVDQMIERIKIIMARLVKLAEHFGGPAGNQLKSAKAVLEPISQIMDMLAKTIGGIRALLDMKLTADAEAKVRAAVAFLQRAIPIVIRGLAAAAAQLQTQGIEAAKRLAAAAGEIFGNIKAMTDALTAIMALNRGDVGAKMDILLSAIRVIMDKLRGFTMNLRELPVLQAVIEDLLAFLRGVEEVAKVLNTGLNIEAVYEAGVSIGKRWIQGIADGIRSQFGLLQDALRNVGNMMASIGGPAPSGATVPVGASGGWGGDSSWSSNVTVNVYNPTGQPSESTVMRSLKTLAAVGVLNPMGGR